MVKEVRIYVEGGGETRKLQSPLREGFASFFREVKDSARAKQVRWYLSASGSRGQAFSDFIKALNSHPEAFNILLIDSEAPLDINHSKWDHLKQRDNWNLPNIDDTHCHFMVCMMEAWLVADIDALAKYYGHGFNENSIPKNKNVEAISKQALETALKDATRHTKTMGEYHKSRHAPDLLRQIDVFKVREAAPHCDRLFRTLLNQINGAD